MIFQEYVRTYCDFACFSKMSFSKITVCTLIKDVFPSKATDFNDNIDNACIRLLAMIIIEIRDLCRKTSFIDVYSEILGKTKSQK